MRENEFEKQVREKMEQLGFDPSDAVWASVNKEINKEKKRRMPLFWLFFVSGLLLAGGAYYFVPNKNTHGIIPNKNTRGIIPNNNTHGTVAKIPEQETNRQPPTANRQPPTVNRQTLPAVQSAEPQKINNKKNGGKTETDNDQQRFAGTGSVSQKPVDHTGNLRSGKKQPRAITTVKTKEMNASGQGAVTAGTGEMVVNNYSTQSAKPETEKDNKKILDSAAGNTVSGGTENKSKKDSVSTSATAKNKKEKTKSSGWKIGYTVSAGFSNLNQNLFNSVKTLSPTTTTNNVSTPSTPGNPGSANYSSSPILAGFSFDAGAFVNRNLSKRISFSAGISYHYYSTKMSTGSKMNTFYYGVNGLFPYNTVSSFYENGNTQTFTNQYHYIEMPLSVNFQLNKNIRKSIIWEIGLSPGYLVGSNALYYNPNANIYTSNYLQPQKLQVNAATAFMFGFPMHKGELQIGPQLQYGLTGFINSNDGNPGHLFYGGLKISFIPRIK
jgi:hypothetical protein